jgi:hypothetical protein
LYDGMIVEFEDNKIKVVKWYNYFDLFFVMIH